MKKLFFALVPPFQQAYKSPNAPSFAKTCTWIQFLSSARTDFKINLMQIATAFPISNGAAVEWPCQFDASPVLLYHQYPLL